MRQPLKVLCPKDKTQQPLLGYFSVVLTLIDVQDVVSLSPVAAVDALKAAVYHLGSIPVLYDGTSLR